MALTENETISHVTGFKYKSQTLTSIGYFVAHCLDAVDTNHVEKLLKIISEIEIILIFTTNK